MKKSFDERFGVTPGALIVDPNERFNKKKNDFREYYANNQILFEDARDAFQSVLSLLTSDVSSGKPKITARVKKREECIRKFETKYRNEVEKNQSEYSIQEYISDLIGIRIICLYEDDLTHVYDIIKQHFKILDVTDKTKQLNEDYNKFGYKGLHLDIELNGNRAKLPEYSAFCKFKIEVQIRSIVQDAWSEIDHKLKYKRSIPDELKRRVIRLAALFELADQEFSAIKTNTELFESMVSDESGDKSASGFLLDGDRPIDSFSFISIMKKHFPDYNFDNSSDSESHKKIDGFVEEIRLQDPWLSDNEFKEIMVDFVPKFERYKHIITNGGIRRMNPFTITRHILFWKDMEKYSECLYPNQKKTFEQWLTTIKSKQAEI
jgi:putative GTP pyrophosphokinase